MKFTSHKYLFGLWLFLFPLYLTFTFNHSLWNPDETRDAGIARSMFVEKDFITPRLNGEAFLEKPPLYYWSCSVVYALSGHVTAGLTRLPAALYGFLGLLFTFLIGRRVFGARAGLLAALLLGTSFQYFRMSHFAMMDSSLTACLTGAFYFYLMGNLFLFLLFVILAFYTKGFIAVALAGLVIGTDLVLEKKTKKLFFITAAGMALFIVLVGPWVYALWKAGGPEYLKIFFIHNNFERFVSKAADHTDNPFFLYFLSFPVDFLPWTLFALAGLYEFFFKQKFLQLAWEKRFLCLWVLVVLIFLTLSKGKRTIYLLPAFPGIALLTAGWFEDVFQGKELRWHEKSAMLTTLVIACLAAVGVFGTGLWLHKKLVLSVIGLGVSLYAVKFIIRNFRRPLYNYAIFGTVFLHGFSLLGSDVLFIKTLDQEKSFVPLCEEIKKNQGHGQLVGLSLSEMERGVFSFYLEGNIPHFQNTGQLENFLGENKNKKILILTNRVNVGLIPEEMMKNLHAIYVFRPDEKTRSYILFSNQGDNHG